ncbi:hypothetical protein BDB00DRAFT_811518 [Zychaea mexicana]|uniref:uncharacterized protein n=1 Tax=Zychaea mexicana TaxID=64656 RepID=UPI0022FDDD82|nr:uncharacterized protein BDB00DRAFT_811518 [Zychaea mexicana]KAI9496051.1 hypothetical protein BDB00DRAFT_811518 [Zychaea mexicana]
MADLNWCTYCDNAISAFSDSLYCSEQCLRADALRNHPLLGYNYEEFVDFPRPYPSSNKRPSCISSTSSPSLSPTLTATTASTSSCASSLRSATTTELPQPPKLDLSRTMHDPNQKNLNPHHHHLATQQVATNNSNIVTSMIFHHR